MAETFETINQWQRAKFPNATAVGILNHIEEEWEEFHKADGIDKIIEAVDLIILLAAYIDSKTRECPMPRGAQPWVDGKMHVNRERKWKIQADGTGRHT